MRFFDLYSKGAGESFIKYEAIIPLTGLLSIIICMTDCATPKPGVKSAAKGRPARTALFVLCQKSAPIIESRQASARPKEEAMALRSPVSFLCASTVIIAALVAIVPAQQQKQSEPTASISGRVTVMGRAASGLHVILLTAEQLSQPSIVSSTKTDAEGEFTLSNLPAGRYRLQPFAPAMVDTTINDGQPGKSIILDEGESLKSINLELSRGGVITGRVMDSNNRPVIGEYITVTLHNEQGRKQEFYYGNYETRRTDDRGVYRLYGLPPGRYSVSAGVPLGQGMVRFGFGNTYYPRTYHPDATDEAAATLIEIKAGSEVTGVDITLGRIEKAYSATGRIVDAETGKPRADVPYGYGSVRGDGRYMGSYGSTGARSGPNGEFLIEGLVPDRYAAIITPWRGEDQAGIYGEPVIFEVKDSDVSGLEIRVRNGAAISGTVVVEGTDEQTAAEKIKELSLNIQVQSEQLTAPLNSIKVAPDGSFRATGLPPGKASFYPGWPRIKGVVLLRTEVEGAEQRGPLDITAGQQISGVKIYFGYGTARIKVNIRLEDGPLPEGALVDVHLRRAGEQLPQLQIRPEIDIIKSRQLFDGLLAGEYELRAEGAVRLSDKSTIPIEQVTQKVTVAGGAETEITLVLKRRDQ
jgi:hypothetical protein